ncbi:DUF6470 family protein [Sporosarcina sp. FSL K6-1508]|uniref:DUF6470 family protein n=1 Tax=Sporosarcina sp. FSL K6-1508 TaxID=2921553 RepID=UPI0030FAAEB2
MNIPQLQIQTTKGILGLQMTKPSQEIEQPRATLSQQQPAAILEISTTRPQLSLDTTEARADVDMKSVFRRSNEYAQLGKQGAMEGIARRAQEGRQLVKIGNGGNAIAAIAKQNTTPSPAPLGIRFVGNRSQIQMAIQPGTLNIQATPQKSINDVQINKPIHNYTQGKVTGQMEQYPSIQIDVKY